MLVSFTNLLLGCRKLSLHADIRAHAD